MKATVSWSGAVLLACLTATAAHAQPGFNPCWCNPANRNAWTNPWFPTPTNRPAPDTCGQPGWYNYGPCGAVYGPNYCLRPCFAPFNGFVPTEEEFRRAQCAQQGQPGGPEQPCPPGQGYPGYPGKGPGQGPHIPPPPRFGFEPPRPPLFPPGMPNGGLQPSPVFPTHPYARSPRDYFMEEEGAPVLGSVVPRSPTDFGGPATPPPPPQAPLAPPGPAVPPAEVPR